MSTPVMDAPAATEKASAPAALRPRLRSLPIMKGSLIAYQWALRMHGFENAIRQSNGK